MTLLIPDNANLNAKRYIETLPQTIEECKSLLPSGFIFQQDGTPAHTAKLAGVWIATNCSKFIGKAESSSPDVNLIHYHVWELCLNTAKHFIQKER